MAWEENPRIFLHMQLIAILSRTEVTITPEEGGCLQPQGRRDSRHQQGDRKQLRKEGTCRQTRHRGPSQT